MKNLKTDKVLVLLTPEEILKLIEKTGGDVTLRSTRKYLDTKYQEYCRSVDAAYRDECLAEQARIKKECTQAALSSYAHSVEQTYNS